MITTGNVVVGGRDGEEGNNVNNVVGGGRDGEEGNNVNNVVGGGRDGEEGNNVNNVGGGDGGGGDGGSHHLTAGGLKKGPWTAAEDAMLVEYVRKYGEGNWNAVQRHSGLARCGKSCRLRWANHLRPNLRKGAFSPEEERLIVELHAKLGNKWARMAALLPGRTDNEIKNYWNTRVKRHQRQGLPLYPPDLLPQNNQQNYNHHHHHHQNHYNHQFSSAPTTPTSSFTFQTHLQSPTAPLLHTPPHTPTPPPLSPLSSPSTTTTTTTNNNNNTLPLFDFALPKAPPILQTPLRFKRYNSTGNISDSGNGNAHLSFPFSPLSISPATGLLGGSDSSSSEFHKEMARENQKMCSLFAAVTQNQMQLELPSNQYLQSTLPQNNWNSGFGVGFDSASNVSKFGGRKMNKRRYSEIGGLELMESGNGFLEDFLAEAKTSAANGVSSMEQDYLFFDEQKPKLLGFDEFSKSWDPSNALTLSSELKLNMEALGRQDTMPEDLTKLLNTLPTSMPHDLYSDSGNISNRQSSVVTEDSIDYEMQQIALLFPTTADQSRTLGSWDTLPRIC